MRPASPGHPRVEVAFSQRKIGFLLAYNLLIVLLSGLLFWWGSHFPLLLDWVMKITAVIALLFSGSSLVLHGIKLLQKSPGFVVDNEGLIDYTEGLSMGRVFWEEIDNIKLWQGMGQSLILIESKPSADLHNVVGGLAKFAMWFNRQRFGATMVITTGTLEIDTDKLYQLMREQKQES